MKTTSCNFRNRFFETPDILQKGHFSLHLGFSSTCKWHFRSHRPRFLKTRVCVYPCGRGKWDWWKTGKMMVSVIAPVCYCSVYWKYTWNIKSRCINQCVTCSRSGSALIPLGDESNQYYGQIHILERITWTNSSDNLSL